MMSNTPKKTDIPTSKFSLSLQGYKHSMVQVVAAALATGTNVSFTNAPITDDLQVFGELQGIPISRQTSLAGRSIWHFSPEKICTSEPPASLMAKIHGSLYLMPALATKFGKFFIGKTGGCQIGSSEASGARPVEHMLRVMRAFGIHTSEYSHGYLGERKERPDHVMVDIGDFSDTPSRATGPLISGATKTAILCSLAAERTIIRRPYLKTDVLDLLRFLRGIGWNTSFDGLDLELARGAVSAPEAPFTLTDCVSEFITFVALSILSQIPLRVQLLRPQAVKEGLEPELSLLARMGVDIIFDASSALVRPPSRLRPIDIEVTNETIQSDHQPFFAAMLTRATGKSTITENVWRDRFSYVDGLTAMGLGFTRKDNTLVVYPSSPTSRPVEVVAKDTRAAAIMLVAAACRPGATHVHGLEHIGRGYENLTAKLDQFSVITRENNVAQECESPSTHALVKGEV